MRLVIVLIMLFGSLPAYATDNPRQWPIADDLSQAQRAAVIDIMYQVEAECSALLFIDWHTLPAPQSDARQVVELIKPNWPADDAWSGPQIEGWSVEVNVLFQLEQDGPFIAITAGGPESVGLAVRKDGGYLGSEICKLDEDRPGGYRFRAIPALADPLSRLTE